MLVCVRLGGWFDGRFSKGQRGWIDGFCVCV